MLLHFRILCVRGESRKDFRSDSRKKIQTVSLPNSWIHVFLIFWLTDWKLKWLALILVEVGLSRLLRGERSHWKFPAAETSPCSRIFLVIFKVPYGQNPFRHWCYKDLAVASFEIARFTGKALIWDLGSLCLASLLPAHHTRELRTAEEVCARGHP